MEHDDTRIERALLFRDFHRNEMETSIRYKVVGGGVTFATYDEREDAESLRAKLDELLIFDVSIEHEYY